MICFLSYFAHLEYLEKTYFLKNIDVSSVLSEKENYEIKVRKLEQDLSMLIEVSNDCWILQLPRHIQIKIIRMLMKLDAMFLAYSMPQLLELIVHPKQWKELKVQINSKVVTEAELKKLFIYTNYHLRKVSIDLDSYENLDLCQIFNEIPHLTSMSVKFSIDKYPNLIDAIILHFGYLNEINITCNGFTSEHLMTIVDNYPHLSSITIDTNLNVDSGLHYALNRLKKIKIIDITALTISVEIINEIIRTQFLNIVNFSMRVKHFVKSETEFKIDLKKLSKLEELCLENLALNDQIVQDYYSLDKLKVFLLNNIYQHALDSELCKNLFINQKLNLNSLYLYRVIVCDDSLLLISKNCPNLRILTIQDALTSEIGLKNALSNLSLEELDIRLSNYSIYLVLFECLNEISEKLVNSMNNLLIELSILDELVSFGIFHLRILIVKLLIKKPIVISNLKKFFEKFNYLDLLLTINSEFLDFQYDVV